jgi:hypothetical protein
MASFVVSDRRTSGVSLATGDSLWLTADGAISTAGHNGVTGSGGNALTLDGEILARAAFGVLLTGGNNNVSVSDTGSVMGDTAISANGPSTVTNAGQVIGLVSDGVSLGTGGTVVSNSGLIFGSTSGITASGAGNDITNYGWIHGGSGSGISLTSDNNVILNFGTIDGGQASIKLGGAAGSTNTIINWGTILGFGLPAIQTADANDVIINRGYLQYHVETGGGNDIVDNSFGGVIVGDILLGAGDDLFIAGVGLFETVVGGAGTDTISYINHPRAMLINLLSQVSADGIGHDIFSSVENAVGSAFDDTIHGDDSPLGNVLDGGPGGSDQIFGRGGPDTVSYASAVRAVLINLAGQVTADGVDTDTLSSIENAIGSRFNDTIYGNDLDNVLDGGLEGSDQIFGGLGTDAASYATSARAVLINLADQVSTDGMNNDTLASIENAIGSAFGDTIVSGAGASVLEGRGGNDTFMFRRGQANGDTVVDFAGNGAFHGDMLQFVGYGPGASFTQIDATHWQVNSGDGLVQETIAFQNGAPVHMSDVLFA